MENLRKSGILLSPTSLPSKYGIGDMGKGAYDFVDFLYKSNQSIWQVLPLGPTGFKNSPYQSFSAFAGNYYIISPDKFVEEGLLKEKDFNTIQMFSYTEVEYDKVISYKMTLFEKAYKNFCIKKERDSDYLKFKLENSFWLDDCCLFAAVKDYYIQKRKYEYETPELKNFIKLTKDIITLPLQKDYYYGGVWVSWENALIKREPKTMSKYKKILKERIEFYMFLQYEFYKQWSELKEYAAKRNIEIIGDIPIFTAWDSADVWANQNLFLLDKNGFPFECAGVPPDYFSPKGQLWGNPLYNWAEHKKTKYNWWIQRIKNCLKLTDIIRIDHFRGFESYYSIPFGMPDATKGEWKKGPDIEFFKAVENEIGNCPFIAEDLGIITNDVKELRLKTNLPGMKILQFAFDESENNDYLPHNYEKNCVVYTGTHDNDTSNGWYQNTSEQCRDYLRRYMNTDASSPSWDLIRLAYSSCANTVIFPLQDVLELYSDARMNTPGTEDGNWTWRFNMDDIKEHYIQHLLYLNKIFKRNTNKTLENLDSLETSDDAAIE